MLLLLANFYSAAFNLSGTTIQSIDFTSENSPVEIIPNPIQEQHFFLLTSEGNIQALEGNVLVEQPLLTKEQISETALEVTALVLHPNFILRDQQGFHTFYTAHIEPATKQTRSTRIQEGDITVNFDIVITEWLLINKTIDIDNKRQVLRIGVENEQSYVSQLAFSPFTKVWNEQFGWLYIALTQDNNNASSPLYSGAILRIDPKKFGLRQYTAPVSNPFTNNESILNEIIIYGLQDIGRFIWPRKDNEQLLVQHTYNQQQQLTLASTGQNFSGNPPAQVVYVAEGKLARKGLMHYRGRVLGHLWNTTLFLHYSGSNWQLLSIVMPKFNESPRAAVEEWAFESKSAQTSPLLLAIDHQQEPLIVAPELSQLIQLTNDVTDASSSEQLGDMQLEENKRQKLNTSMLFGVIFIGLIFVYIAYIIRKKLHSAKFIVRQQYSKFTLSESGQQLQLFKRHQKDPALILEVSQIIESKLSLNKVCIADISAELAFSNAKEGDVREQYNLEKRNKMVTDRIRRLTLELVDADNHHYPICVYLRKGDNRVTRQKFSEIIEEVIDWCWLFSSVVAPNETEQREYKPKEVQPEKVPDAVWPTYKRDPVVTEEKVTPTSSTNVTESHLDNAVDSLYTAVTVPNQTISSTPVNTETEHQETELVDALEKLAKLRQQGALTPEEFELAKQKVLKGLLK